MFADITKDKDGFWSITPLEGKFAGQPVMRVEKIALNHARFTSTGLTGAVRAVWGAMIPDHLNLDWHTLKGLGIGGTFVSRAGHPMTHDGGCFFDAATGQPMQEAFFVLLHSGSGFYGNRHERRWVKCEHED